MENAQTQAQAAQVVVLTPAQLKEVVSGAIVETIATMRANDAEREEAAPRYVYGLRGIADLFKVSPPTAQQYKDTWLAPAVMQRGHRIITNATLAMRLFDERGQQ